MFHYSRIYACLTVLYNCKKTQQEIIKGGNYITPNIAIQKIFAHRGYRGMHSPPSEAGWITPLKGFTLSTSFERGLHPKIH